MKPERISASFFRLNSFKFVDKNGDLVDISSGSFFSGTLLPLVDDGKTDGWYLNFSITRLFYFWSYLVMVSCTAWFVATTISTKYF